MTLTVNMETTANISIRFDTYRQNCTPAAAISGEGRHWLLDFSAGRDLLKAAMRRAQPGRHVAVWKRDESLDDSLAGYIDRLGLRSMPKPLTNREKFHAAWKLFKMTLAVECGALSLG